VVREVMAKHIIHLAQREPPIRMYDEFLKGDIKGPPERRFVEFNVTMLAPLVTDAEVDVTVPEGQTGEFD
jgi:hypothetical protein